MNRASLSRVASYVLVLFLLAGNAAAAVFVVPDDAELIAKSQAIVTGTVTGSFVDESDRNFIRTIYEVRVDRPMKGGVGGVIQVASPGGVGESAITLVPGAAHFENGDRVLLFLTRHKGHWTPTDMTVGKFRFVTSTGGQSLLVRDEEDIVGFDRQMRTHVERIRRQDTFLKFIEETVRGRAAVQNYFVAPGETIALPKEERRGPDLSSNSAYTAKSYAMLDSSGVYGFRWMSNRMSASVTRNFYKNAAQHASGLGDGGVAMITSSLNAWTNDCPSVVNIAYAGTHANLKASDGVNVVVWNDPGGHVGSGGWTGSGTIAIAFLNGAVATYDGDPNWVAITDADIVVQDGLTGAESFMATAMTHEVGHSVGIRHSNTNGTGGSCSTSNECSTSAIMRSSVGTLYNYTLQTWDQNAVAALYPGGSCEVCTAPAISSQPLSTSIAAGSSANLSVTATGSATLAYQWYRGASGTTSDPVSGATSAALSISPSTTTSYWVRVTNSCGTANSAAATVTVSCAAPPSITGQPASTTITSGQTTALSVVASSPAAMTYQWYRGSVGTTSDPVSGATAAQVNVAPTVSTTYWVRVTNSCGFTNSAAATVTVNAPCTGPGITSHPTAQTINSGAQATLSVTATGTATLTYQWYRGASGSTGDPVSGATSATLNISPTSTTTYWVRVTNGCGSVNSTAATVTVNATATLLQPDFNANGHDDLLWREPSTGKNVVWFMNGTTRASVGNLAGVSGTAWSMVAVGNFNGDAHPDIVWRNSSTGANVVWLMNGITRASYVSLPSAGTSWKIVGAGDFNADGKSDIVLREQATGNNVVWLMNGTSRTSIVNLLNVAAPWTIVGAGDFNSDGKSDIVWRNPSSGGNVVWMMNGTTRSSAVSLLSVSGSAWVIGSVGDFNNDGKSDLAWQNTSTGANVIWLMSGTTRTSSVALPSVPTSWFMQGPR